MHPATKNLLQGFMDKAVEKLKAAGFDPEAEPPESGSPEMENLLDIFTEAAIEAEQELDAMDTELASFVNELPTCVVCGHSKHAAHACFALRTIMPKPGTNEPAQSGRCICDADVKRMLTSDKANS